MHLTRRMRLIWHKLWLIPLVGATADVVAGEAAKLGGVTVPLPWLFSAIGVAGMLGAAVVRAYSVPLIPEGLDGPDEALTRRSRVLGERLGATPVRVFVADLPKLRGKVDTFLDGHDLFVSERVAELPEAQRDFVLARALVVRGPVGRFHRHCIYAVQILGAATVMILGPLITISWVREWNTWWIHLWNLVWPALTLVGTVFGDKRYGAAEDRAYVVLALKATGNLPAPTTALSVLADTAAEHKQASADKPRSKNGGKPRERRPSRRASGISGS